MNPASYEDLVEDICDQLVGESNAKVLRKKYRGSSGQEHQIDVAVEWRMGGVTVLFLIECKWWREKVGLAEVLTLEGRLRDIGAHKGIIVTTIGFQEGAVVYARDRGIALVTCSELGEAAVLDRTYLGAGRTRTVEARMKELYERRFAYFELLPDRYQYTALPILIDELARDAG